MLPDLTDLTKATLFFVLAFGLCVAVALLAPVFGARTPLVAMATPLAAALLMLLVVTRDGYAQAGWKALGVHRAGLRGWGLAVGVPAIVLGVAYGVVWASGVGALVPSGQSGGPAAFVVDLGLSIAVVTLLFTIEEEIGWRGYLLPHLMNVGPRRALLLSGLLHGVWHLPVMIGTPYYHGAGNRLIVVPLFLATLTAAGVCYGYLRLVSASVWPAAIAHSVFNVAWERLRASTVTASPVALEYLAGESGVLTLCGLVAVAAFLTKRISARPAPG
jgi:membrane protease YdiL (CAAX protease family)